MKKLIYTFFLLTYISSFTYGQPVVNGQFVVLINNGTNYIVKVQISTNTGTDALGDATIPFTFNNTDLTYVGSTFQNFTGGDYFAATATNSPANRISLNITFNMGSGTVVSSSFMDVATITFSTINPVGSSNLAFTTPMEFFSTSFILQWTNGTFTDENTTPLPIELTSFNGSATANNKIKLSWNTNTETNNYGFDVERSTNTVDDLWEKIGFLQGYGNSNAPKDYSFIDENPVGGNKFHYRLKQIDNDGTYEYSDVVEVELLPTEYELFQNYPNPFNPSTSIKFSLPEDAKVSIRIYNMLGELVDELVNKDFEAGYHKVDFNAANYASGVYIYSFVTNNFTDVKKLILLK